MSDAPEQLPHPDHSKCEQEQVQLIGQIQPYGILFALSEPDFVVRQVSANVLARLGKSPETVIGKSFEHVLGAQQFEAFRFLVHGDRPLIVMMLKLSTNDGSIDLDCSVHRRDGMLIAEFELLEGAHSLGALDVDNHIRAPLANMERAPDIEELSRVAANEVRRLSGFDRVMVYRFDKDWNGEVLAEIKNPSADAYLGLRFPASDIPPQVRRLFLINTLRAIADVEATSIKIVPNIGPPAGRALDLTRSLLRSVSPIHLEYLRNMRVEASLTISIVVKGRLWGMIACHHDTPRRVDRSIRSVLELIAQSLASLVALRLENFTLQRSVTARELLENYVGLIETSKSHFGDCSQRDQLLDLFEVDGLICRIAGVTSSQGTAPEGARLTKVISKLQNRLLHGIASSDCLGELDAEAGSFAADASGALYIGIGDTGDYLLFLRRELLETVMWAGNPKDAVSTDSQQRLHPRVSFGAWREIVRGRSRPWAENEVKSASLLREELIRIERNETLTLLTARFNMATRAARVGIFERGANWEIIWWSEVMWDIFGQDLATFDPTHAAWLALIHPGDRERIRAELVHLKQNRSAVNLLYRIVRPDGELRHIRSIGAPTSPHNALVDRFAGVTLDVTELIQAQEREHVLQSQLRESSRLAGMAEVATGVLHNVGNVLNSLGIANTTACRDLKTMRLDRLEQVTALLLSNRATLASFLTDDERGRHFPDYLPALATQIAANGRAIQAELETTEQLLHHLGDIVSAQQELARIGGRRESIRVSELIETALLVQASELVHIELVREYEELPLIMTDRHKLVQILVNLISNARDAVQAGAGKRSRIVVKLGVDGDHVVATIEDSGIGMTEETLSRLWQFGYTTKKKGHGFGLHNSANAAREIGATLTAHSDGVGRGSRFILRLPIDDAEPLLSGVAG